MPYLGNNHIVGDSVNNFKVLDDISSFTATFDGSASSVVSTTDETIKVLKHRFVQGQRVTYNNGGGSNIGGLTSGTAYYVIYDTAHTIKLATSASNAASLTSINLNAVGGGTSHTLNAAFDGVNKKFRITHGNGNRPRFHHATQLSIAINNVVQRPNNDANNFTEGYAIEVRDIIVFKTAPTVNDIFFGSLTGETRGTFEITDHKIDSYTGDGSTTLYDLSQNVPNNESLLVSLNGVIQHPTTSGVTRSYSLVSGVTNKLQFTTAPALGVEIQIRHLGFAGASSGDVSGFYGRTGNVGLTAEDHITTGDITSRNINSSGIITATSFIGSGAALTGIDATAIKDSGGNVKVQAQASGAMYTGIHTFTTLNSSTGTFSGAIDANGDLDVDGHTNLDNLSVAGVATFASAVNTGALTASSGTFSGNVSIGGTLTYEDVKNVDSVGIVTAREGIFIPDNKKLQLGNAAGSGDLQIFHDSNNSYIENSTSSLFIRSDSLQLYKKSSSERYIVCASDAAVKLFYNNDLKLETSTKGIQVGTGVTIETNGQATYTGIVTAQKFVGDGSQLTGITQTTINNNADNRVITGSGSANTLNGESLLTFDGNKLLVASDSYNILELRADENNDGGNDDSMINFTHDGTKRAEIRYDESASTLELSTSDNRNDLVIKSDGHVAVNTTGALKVPVGTTAQRPGSAVTGDIRYNTTANTLEFYTGTGWLGTNLLPSINSVTGTIYNGTAGNLVINANDITTSVSIKYSNNSTGSVIATDTSPSISGANITSAIPSAVYNTAAGTVIKIEVVNSDGSVSSNSATKTIVALPSGGTKTTSGGYTYHTFTSSGTFSQPLASLAIECLVVAGGGGGGSGDDGGGGGSGGGAGGAIDTSATLSTGNYTVTVGGGGQGGNRGGSQQGAVGSNSLFNSNTAVGGGRGIDSGGAVTPSNGGSGGGGFRGGAGGTGTSGQGNNGGAGSGNSRKGAGGGGGGGDTGGDNAGGAGGGNGGSGTGGGGNGTAGGYSGNNPNHGTANRGGGGGGTGASTGTFYTGSNGGSGVVIIRYQL